MISVRFSGITSIAAKDSLLMPATSIQVSCHAEIGWMTASSIVKYQWIETVDGRQAMRQRNLKGAVAAGDGAVTSRGLSL